MRELGMKVNRIEQENREMRVQLEINKGKREALMKVLEIKSIRQ